MPIANAPSVTGLQTLYLRSNWRGDKTKLPHFMVPGFAPQLEEFANYLVGDIANASPALRIGWAGESTNVPGQSRPLRVVDTLQPGHHAGCDINLYASGGNLCVRMEAHPRTRIVWLRRAIYTGLFFVLFTIAYGAVMIFTDQYTALAREFSQKVNGETNQAVMYEKIVVLDRWTYLEFFRNDPGLFLLTVGKLPLLLAAAIGGLLMVIPKDLMRYPCKQAGYPLPDKFRAAVNAHNANMVHLVSQTLINRYGIDRSGQIPIEGG